MIAVKVPAVCISEKKKPRLAQLSVETRCRPEKYKREKKPKKPQRFAVV